MLEHPLVLRVRLGCPAEPEPARAVLEDPDRSGPPDARSGTGPPDAGGQPLSGTTSDG
ncbi:MULTISPECIES: hypothetical protein [Streptomyces]|uniref:Uncharacterized protein n=1 Tax=Streptomyces cremeus TaxID=66881 RepID=A0ABV5PKG9_STRCM